MPDQYTTLTTVGGNKVYSSYTISIDDNHIAFNLSLPIKIELSDFDKMKLQQKIINQIDLVVNPYLVTTLLSDKSFIAKGLIEQIESIEETLISGLENLSLFHNRIKGGEDV